MDYSLLTVIEFNPEYVKMNPDEFKHDKNGALTKPVQFTTTKEKQMQTQDQSRQNLDHTIKKSIHENFMNKLADTQKNFK